MSATVQSGKKTFTIKSAADAFKVQQAIDYVVDKLIGRGWIVLFFGHPGTKKTWVLLVLAVCVALGTKFLGFTTKKCRVLWIDEESGESYIARRIAAVIRGALGDDQTPIDFMSLPGFRFDNPNQGEDTLDLTTIINSGGYELVIIDALADVMQGDENLVKDVRPVFQNLKLVASATGAAIVLIHHSNKAGGYRGSSFIKGNVDVMIHVESDTGSDLIKFSTEKIREGEPESWGARAVWDPDQFFLQTAQAQTPKSSFTPSEVFVIQFLEDNGASTVDDIADGADICTGTAARRSVYELAKKGITFKVQASGKKSIYDLTVKGQAEAKSL